MNRPKTVKSDFTFRQTGFGRYFVYYQSPVTKKISAATITDMELIDAVKNCDKPTVKDMNLLKKIIKANQ